MPGVRGGRSNMCGQRVVPGTAPELCRVLGQAPGVEQCWSIPDCVFYLVPESAVEDAQVGKPRRDREHVPI